MRTTLTLRAEELVMRAYCDESHRAYTFVVKDCAVVASDVNASATRVGNIYGMIIQSIVKFILNKQLEPLVKLFLCPWRKLWELFLEGTVVLDFHLSCRR